MPYSAVTQPRPCPASQRGTPCSTLAVQITCVSPTEISAEPVAGGTKSGSIVDRRAARRRARPSAARHAASASGNATCSICSIGICRKREPSSRKASTSPVHRKR